MSIAYDRDTFIARVTVTAPTSSTTSLAPSTRVAEFQYQPRMEDATPWVITHLLTRCPRAECKKWVDVLNMVLDPNEVVRIRSMPVSYTTSARAQDLGSYDNALLALPASGAQAFEFSTTRPCGPLLLRRAMVPYDKRTIPSPEPELRDLGQLKVFVARLAMAMRGPRFGGVTFTPNTLHALPIAAVLSHLNECIPLSGYLYSPSLRNLLLITQDHSVYCVAISQGVVGKVSTPGVDLDIGLLGGLAFGVGLSHPLDNIDIVRLFPEAQEAFWAWRQDMTRAFRLGQVYH